MRHPAGVDLRPAVSYITDGCGPAARGGRRAMPIWSELREDVGAIMARDPAARSRLEVVLCYPGFHALLFHRAAHALWRRGWIVAGAVATTFLARTKLSCTFPLPSHVTW